MNKNAIVIAAIMFLVGCAHQGGYGEAQHGNGQGHYSAAPAPRASQGDRNFPSGASYNASNTPMVFREKLPAPAFDETGTGRPASDTQTRFGSSGDDLAQRVKRELAIDSPGTHTLASKESASNISVTSDKGRITLRGSVPSEQDKLIIGLRAAKVEGVDSVDN